MKTRLLCVYPIYRPALIGFHVYVGIAGWRWWGVEITNWSVRRLPRYVVTG